jgi:hypothetical protein
MVEYPSHLKDDFTSYFTSNVAMNRYGLGRPFLEDVAARIEHCNDTCIRA